MTDATTGAGGDHGVLASTLTHDLLGHPITDAERQLLDLYERLKRVASRDDLPPCAQQNVRKALACLWQVTNDLDLQFEQLYDLEV
jgi:hypothetical protein